MHPRIKEVLDALAAGNPVTTVDLQIVHARFEDRPVTFCVNFERDPVQNNHRRGTFYEKPELWAIRKVFPKGGTFVDIGANVGNHTLFAALYLGARVIPFEPNPLAFELLIANVLANGLTDQVDLRHVGLGLSDGSGKGFRAERRRRNLGAARLFDSGGDVEVERADVLLDSETPDYIKIDVEGMEMRVLSGLEGLLIRCKPILLVEVDNSNEAEFFDWVAAQGYAPVSTHQRYRQNKNHMIADASRAEDLAARVGRSRNRAKATTA